MFRSVFPPALPILLLLLLAPLHPARAATLEPLGLQDARLLPKDRGELRLGLSYASDLHNQFQSPDLDRRIAELPSLTLNLGLGERVEGQLAYAVLQLDEDGRGSEWGSGDLTLAFKVRLVREGPALPALALRVATKLPNADEKKDLGTDETDVFLDLLAARAFPALSVHLNLGLAILGDPRPGDHGQDDLLHYGVGVVVPLDPALELLLSAEGMTLGEAVNHRGALRGGLRYGFGRFTWDLGGSLGYSERSEEWGVRTGLTASFDLPAAW